MQSEALLQLLSWVTGDLAAGMPHYCTKLAAIVDGKNKILALDQSISAVRQCMACLEKLHEFMVMVGRPHKHPVCADIVVLRCIQRPRS